MKSQKKSVPMVPRSRVRRYEGMLTQAGATPGSQAAGRTTSQSHHQAAHLYANS